MENDCFKCYLYSGDTDISDFKKIYRSLKVWQRKMTVRWIGYTVIS